VLIGIDIGGTFTDIVFVDSKEKAVGFLKVPSTPGRLQEGVISVRTPGGGGYGDASERPRELVLQDYHEGRISAEYAIKHFGVDPRGKE